MTRWIWLLVGLVLTSCLLPWVVNPGAGLSLNAVDWAEWTSLAPAVQAQAPALLTPFLLRTPLLIAAVLVGLAADRHRGWAALLIALLAAAQLPPFEFLADTGNANYQQQALLAAWTLGLGWLVLFALPRRSIPVGLAVTALAGLAAALAGVVSAFDAMRAYGLDARIGPGAVLYGGALAFALGLAVSTGIKKRRGITPPLHAEQAGVG